jgi:hypothetical protein
VVALVVGVVTAFGVRHYRRAQPVSPRPTINASAVALPQYDDSAYNTRAPDSVRITVEVLNATHRHGLARRATLYLRDRGFDVVLIGNAEEQHDHTVVYDRSGHQAWAQLVAKAMAGRVETRPDTSRYVDVTVLVGQDWNPPALPFYP